MTAPPHRLSTWTGEDVLRARVCVSSSPEFTSSVRRIQIHGPPNSNQAPCVQLCMQRRHKLARTHTHAHALEDAVLTGALLGARFRPSTDGLLQIHLMCSGTGLARAAAEAVTSSAPMRRLAVNLYQLHGPFFSFRATQCHAALRTVAERVQACRRPREQSPWAAREVVKLQGFCRGLRMLIRQKQFPQVLQDALALDAAALAAAAESLRSAQSPTKGQEDSQPLAALGDGTESRPQKTNPSTRAQVHACTRGPRPAPAPT